MKQYKKDFLAYDIDVYFTDDGMEGIAKEAETEETGARGLMTVCERIFREYKYQLPDHDVKEFIVGQEMTENPIEKLKSLLEDPTQYRSKVVEFQLGKIEQELSARYGIEIAFTPEASQCIAEKAPLANSLNTTGRP